MHKRDIYPQVAHSLLAEELEQERIVRLAVTGDSMAPLIRRGDTVVVKRLGSMPGTPGEILIFEEGGDYLTHRLVACSAEGWLTKGDALFTLDNPVDPQRVLGRVVAVERGGRERRLDGAAWQRRGRWIAALGRLQSGLARRWLSVCTRGDPERQPGLVRMLARAFAAGFRVAIRILSGCAVFNL